jgi:GTPase SAR1 family protein
MVSEERARALASEFGLPYIDTSAKDNHNVNEAFMQLATSIKQVTEEATAAAASTGDGATAPGGNDGEVQPLVLISKPADNSSSGGCC